MDTRRTSHDPLLGSNTGGRAHTEGNTFISDGTTVFAPSGSPQALVEEEDDSSSRDEDIEVRLLLDTDFRKLMANRMTCDLHKQIKFIAGFWTVICILLALNSKLLLVVSSPFFVAGLRAAGPSQGIQFTPVESRAYAIQAYQRGTKGRMYFPERRTILRDLAFSTLVSCVGLLGLLTTVYAVLKSWTPDFEKDDASPGDALWVWFAGFACVLPIALAGYFLLSLLWMSCQVYYKMRKPPQPATEPPRLPIIRDRVPPLIECSTLTNAFWILAAMAVPSSKGSGLAAREWIGMAGMLLILVLMVVQTFRIVLQGSRIQLYIDWAKIIDYTSVEPYAHDLLAYHEKVARKYWIGWFCGGPILGGIWLPKEDGQTDLPALLALVLCTFVFLNVVLWAVWRRFPSPPHRGSIEI